ncbi:MAG: response regulator transcription factor [Verrucomicrobia bacterium]|nr:response regulator transcription factor [Verrucomicrobiota bacterium]
MTLAVAIVEDDQETRKILAGWIKESPGFRLVGDWGDAESAFGPLSQHQPDVVMMDINLPGLSGCEAVKKLKPMLPAAQYVMLTVYEDTDHIFDALAAGATGYLLKQTPKEELLRALTEVHRGGSPMNSRIARKIVQSFRQNSSSGSDAFDLSPREQEVLVLLARGYLYKEISAQLGVTIPTINTYVRRVYEKLHVRSRAQAVAKYANLNQEERSSSRPRRET